MEGLCNKIGGETRNSSDEGLPGADLGYRLHKYTWIVEKGGGGDFPRRDGFVFRLELAETRSGLVRGARLVEGGLHPGLNEKERIFCKIYTRSV